MRSTERSVGTLAGTEIRIDMMSIVLLGAMIWHLAFSVMPALVPEIATQDYWVMAGLTAMGVVGSLILKEIVASAASAQGRPRILAFYVTGAISLAEHNGSISRVVCEWLVAILTHLFVAVSLLWLFVSGFDPETPLRIPGVVLALIALNVGLCVLDTLPVYPNRGARVLVAILMRKPGDADRARMLAGRVGWVICTALGIGGAMLLAAGWWGTGGWVLVVTAILSLANFNANSNQRRNR